MNLPQNNYPYPSYASRIPSIRRFHRTRDLAVPHISCAIANPNCSTQFLSIEFSLVYFFAGKEYLEQDKNGQLSLPPMICRKDRIQEGDLLKALINKAGSIHPISLTKGKQKFVEQCKRKDIHW